MKSDSDILEKPKGSFGLLQIRIAPVFLKKLGRE